VQIARMKAERNAPVGRMQNRGLTSHRPLTRKGPMIEPQPLGSRIEARLVQFWLITNETGFPYVPMYRAHRRCFGLAVTYSLQLTITICP
jgi:hypothetical protein